MTKSELLKQARLEQPYPQPQSPNHLIYKDSISHPKPSTYDLPEDEYRYGSPPRSDPEGVGKLMHWKSANYNNNSPTYRGRGQPFSVDQLPANYVFGCPNKPSTPMGKIVTHEYLREHEERAKNHYETIKAEQELAHLKATALPEFTTKNSSQLRESPKAPFKMSKFNRVPPKTVSRFGNDASPLRSQKNSPLRNAGQSSLNNSQN